MTRARDIADRNFADNDRIVLGNNTDLQIFHNATNSIIKNNTGYLALRSQDGGQIRIEDASGNANALFNDNSDVKLRYNASDRLVTTSDGVEVTGTSKSDLVVVDSSGGATPTYSHTNNGEGITLRYNDDSGARAADIVAIGNNPAGATMAMRFFVNPNSTDAASEVMRIQNGKVGINTTNPTLQTSVNFDSSALAGLGINDTNSGNLGGMLQFYSGSGQGTLRANMMNANNAGVHMALGTSGTVVFGGTTYTAAKALDDYEEGVWTATLTGSTSNPSSTVETTSARYTRVGRQVFVQGQFTNVDTTGAAGAPRVTGLPFGASTSFSTGNVMFYNRFTLGTTSSNVSPYVAGSTIFFYQSTNQTGWAEVAHSAGSGAYLAFTAVYDV